MEPLNNRVGIFCSYIRKDEHLLEELKEHLSPLQRKNLIDVWYDRNISAGMERGQEIKKYLNEAHIILLLISPAFIHSDYCYGTEMKCALERHKQKEAIVIPVILRPCAWQDTSIELGSLQALPKGTRSVTEWKPRDKAWKQVAEEIKKVVHELLGKSLDSQSTTSHNPLLEEEAIYESNKRHSSRNAYLESLTDELQQSTLLKHNVESFVGREQELKEIDQYIAETQTTGGYVIIAGPAGQGKTGIIAKLVQKYGPEQTAYHFIRINPRQGYQEEMLIALMARLILKYDLSKDSVENISPARLGGCFSTVLAEVANKGGKEVIFIDGLDQLRIEERDLSFLPPSPPEGIVLVLGTRPNDTLEPLQFLKPCRHYNLPNLSRSDFGLILKQRKVDLKSTLADQIYAAMEQNALFLDLTAQQLAQEEGIEPEEIIKRIEDNPGNIFGWAIERLRREPDNTQWVQIIEPTLGTLLVAREPLSLRLIKEIICTAASQNIDEPGVKKGLERLGGLVMKDGEHRYTLFHLKLYDYLREDEKHPDKAVIFSPDKEEYWHKALAQWCEQGELADIWEDVKKRPFEQEKRQYTRLHYLTHLYHAHEWKQLFEVLDAGRYGQAKIRNYSTRAYIQDLYLGQLAAAWEGWNLKDGVNRLPNLWRYTLLRCSLADRADQYPVTAFGLLVLLGRIQEALGLAELLTEPNHKGVVLIEIAQQLAKFSKFAGSGPFGNSRPSQAPSLSEEQGSDPIPADPSQKATESQKILLRACELLGGSNSVETLVLLGGAFAEERILEVAHLAWDSAEQLVPFIQDDAQRAQVLVHFASRLTEVRQMQRAEKIWAKAQGIIYSIRDNGLRAQLLADFANFLAGSQKWQQAQRIVHSISHNFWRAQALVNVGRALARASQSELAQQAWAEAQQVVGEDRGSSKQDRAQIFIDLGRALAETQDWEHAKQMWIKAEEICGESWDVWTGGTQRQTKEQAQTLASLGRVLAQMQQWRWSDKIIHTIQDNEQKMNALVDLGKALAEAQRGQQAHAIWTEVEPIIHSIQDDKQYISVLIDLAKVLIDTQQCSQAQQIVSSLDQYDEGRVAQTLARLGRALAEAQEWQQAEQVIRSIQRGLWRARAWADLGKVRIDAEQLQLAYDAWDEAEQVSRSIQNDYLRALALIDLGKVLAKSQQLQRAQEVWNEARRIISSIQDGFDGFVGQWTVADMSMIASETRRCKQQKQEIERELNHLWSKRHVQGHVLAELGKALAEIQEWQEAEQIIHSIQDHYWRAWALTELGKLFAKAVQWSLAWNAWTDAKQAINTISDGYTDDLTLKTVPSRQGQPEGDKDNYLQAEAFTNLGKALIEAQQWQEAQEVISVIQDSYRRAETLIELGRALAEAQEWQEAQKVWIEAQQMIQSLRDNIERNIAFTHLGKVLAKEQEWDWYEEIKRSIQYDFYMIELTSDVFTTAKLPVPLLKFTQQLWLYAQTRKQALQGFSSAHGLILSQPSLGPALCEAFTWVNGFLKEQYSDG